MTFDRHARVRREVALPDGTSARTGLFVPSGDHGDDRFFKAAVTPPAHVDLRDELSHVEDQRSLDSCTANALAAAHELLERRADRWRRPLSRLFIYYNARVIEHDRAHDDGITIRDGVHGMRRHGVCTEETWPYLASRVLEKPTERAFEEARRHVLSDAERVHIDVDAMRAALAAGLPVVFGIMLFQSFGGGGNHGRIPDPEPHEEHLGGHSMVAVGYDDRERVFVVRNSWGASWGERGHCFLSYAYVGDRRFTDEAWVLRSERRAAAPDR